MVIKGGCLCSKVRYEITGSLLDADHCHYSMCRRQHGATLAGTNKGKIVTVMLGTIEGDPAIKPGSHIFVGSKAQWHDIYDDLPQFEKRPPDK